MITGYSSPDGKAAGVAPPPDYFAGRLLELDSAMKKSSEDLIDILTNLPSGQRYDIPIDEARHFPEDDVFDPVTGSQYFLHRHAVGSAPPAVHLHFFQRWRPAELQLQGGGTITTHLAGLELNALAEPVAWFVVNQWVVGDYWQPADDTVRLFRDWRIEAPQEGRGKEIPDICHQWLEAYLKLSLSAIIYPLLRERDSRLDRLVDSYPGTNVLESKSHEVLGYHRINFKSQLDVWKREAGF